MAAKVTYNNAMKMMGWRAKILGTRDIKFPNKSFKTLLEFSQYVNEHPESLKYKETEVSKEEEAIRVKIVKSSSKHEHVIFYDENLLKKFTKNENFIDGTFKSRPNVSGCAQLLTILGRSNNKVSLNIIITCCTKRMG